ncbi:MAG: hypothetical protein J6P73_04115 [Bacteroidales bacterium]|nr:hypothetical protein [Bacteroidales bacterium]
MNEALLYDVIDSLTDNKTRTKRYIGNCEYMTETTGNASTEQWLTYLTGPTGVYAVVVTENGVNTLHYILKDNLGSWTTITDSEGFVEQRLSYDARGNRICCVPMARRILFVHGNPSESDG